MTFQVPASKASRGQDQFEFQIDDATYKIKKAKFLTITLLEELAADVKASLAFFGEVGTPQGDAVRGLERDQFVALVEAWNNDSGVTPGESPASKS